MQSPHFLEFQSLVEHFSEQLFEAQLQDIMTNDNGIVLQFYRFTLTPHLVWMVFDLDMQRPFVGLFETNPWARLKSKKPMGLFLTAHLKNNIVNKISFQEKYGRILEIEFNTGYKIEFRLIPKQPNLLASIDKKKMSWFKPKDLVEVVNNEKYSNDIESRSVPYMLRQWLREREMIHDKNKKQQQSSMSSYESWVLQKQKDITKKTKALIALNEQINNPQIALFKTLGEHLKVYGLKSIPNELIDLIDYSQTVSWNIQNCFSKSKQATAKITGALKRTEIIESELLDLEDLSEIKYQKFIKKQSEVKQFQASRKKTVGEFRKLILDTALGINCLMGKSAIDNLKLLRQSKAWDLWLHLKDFPSAYAIIQKNKDQKISDDMIRLSAQWLAKEGSKTKNIVDTKTAIVIVECRHVRPIKGDKIGRVTYNNAREMLITV